MSLLDDVKKEAEEVMNSATKNNTNNPPFGSMEYINRMPHYYDNQPKNFQNDEVMLILQTYVQNIDLFNNPPPSSTGQEHPKKALIRRMTEECTSLGHGIRTQKQVVQKLRDELKKLRRFRRDMEQEDRKTIGKLLVYPRASQGTLYLFNELVMKNQSGDATDPKDMDSFYGLNGFEDSTDRASSTPRETINPTSSTSNRNIDNCYSLSPSPSIEIEPSRCSENGRKRKRCDSDTLITRFDERQKELDIELKEQQIRTEFSKQEYYRSLTKNEELISEYWRVKTENERRERSSAYSSHRSFHRDLDPPKRHV